MPYVPRVLITDKLPSYGAAKAELLPGVEHRQQKGLNNRVENVYQPLVLAEDARSTLWVFLASARATHKKRGHDDLWNRPCPPGQAP